MADLTCQCCGKQASLDPEAAYKEGWDAPPYFTQVVLCPACPSSHFMLGEECTHDWTDEKYKAEVDKMKANPAQVKKLELLIKLVSDGRPDVEDKLRKTLL